MKRIWLAAVVIAHAMPALAAEPGSPAAGLDYARENCAECHAVEPGDYDSPDMAAPGFTEIANVDGMSELALISFFQTPHPTMPNFIVESADVASLVAYIRSLKH